MFIICNCSVPSQLLLFFYTAGGQTCDDLFLENKYQNDKRNGYYNSRCRNVAHGSS